MLWIGLMSGTSADAVDAALIRLDERVRDLELLAFVSEPLSGELRERIRSYADGFPSIRDFVRLDLDLGERFAAAALSVIARAGISANEVAAIGSHGQTVGHFPEPEVRGTLQLGAASTIHARTGIPVVHDFRRADMAAGGQGAPLTPYFHHHYFARKGERRAVLNIGGFTNITYLDGDDISRLIAFDPGPGNALLDTAARKASGGAEEFDRDGRAAHEGRVIGEVVDHALTDPYFSKPPPKSTGHEYFNAEFLARIEAGVRDKGGSHQDLMATLAAITVESTVRASGLFPAPAERWIVYGGGALNPVIMDGLRTRLAPLPVETSSEHGVPFDALEAVAFAVLGWASFNGQPSNVPAATGAAAEVTLGSLTPPAGVRR